MNDEEIVQRVRAGDTEAYALLVQRYREAIYGLAYHYLKNAEDAQDVTQQAFVHAFQRLEQLRDPAKFGPWLRQVVVNQYRMCQRQRRPISIEEVHPATCGHLERTETRLVVEQALACLSDASRLTLTLFYLHSLSLAEIAALLAVPITTVKSRLRNTRARLRQELWEMAEEILTPEPLPEDFARQVMQMIPGGGILSIAFARDGKTLVSGSSANTVKLWDVRSGALLRTLEGHFCAVDEVAFSPDGTRIASASRDRTLRLWDAATGELKATITDHGRPYSLAFAPRSKVLAHASAWFGPDYEIILSRVVLRNAQTGELLRELEVLPWHTPDAKSAQAPPLHGMLYGIAFSPDGKLLATCNSVAEGEHILGGQVKLWDARTGEKLRTLTAPGTAMLKSIAFSPDRQTLAGACSQLADEPTDGSEDRQAASYVQLWQVSTGEPFHLLAQAENSVVQRIAFSADGKTLMVHRLCSGKNEALLFDWQTGKQLQTFTPNSEHPNLLTFSPDGRMLAGSAGDHITLWEIR